jgi:radical SAM protein with 4Fe4S-binding SPASM domain
MGRGSQAVTMRTGQAALRMGRRSLLGRLDLELTERCNNDCIHCYINLPADDTAARAQEMPTDEVQAILEEAAALGCWMVRFTGGEPLLREDFEALYLHARRLGLKVTLFTNATLLTPHLADLLARTPPLGKIEVSLYGMKRQSYEAVTRTPGSFEAAWRGIHLLLERRVPFVVKGALLPPNRDEMEEFEAWAADTVGMKRAPSYALFLDLRCRRDSAARNRRIARLRLSPAEGVAVLTRRPERYLSSMRQFCAKFSGPMGDQLLSCGAGRRRGSVDAYGRLQPCLLLRQPQVVYDLKTGSLRDALTVFFPQLQEIRATNPDYLARCARCFLKNLCEQCPAKSWMEHGTLDTPVEYLCAVTHARARDAGLLREGEVAWEVQNWEERVARFVGTS